ncbi:MAG: metallophosphoesterase [Candidatus Heimdallarchaeota archaeon]|nr:metallophosphoesterase [Candidatus Heimdallarchaeota archaeon]MCK4955907.1 metallophosphoesterase [Candidatus Heimdallarchaeota archaeon]
MVTLFHFSDTHVSHRRFRDVRDSWKVLNRVTWIEDDYCLGFKKALEIASETECDYLVHSGDLFDIPVGRNFSGPTEYSRAFVIKELRNFFEKTENNKPLIIIDGNHGTYLTRNNSTLEFIQAAFPKNVHIFTNYHLKDAIREDKPLILEFDDINFYLFPYLKFGRLENWYKDYEKWLRNNQQPDSSKISVAVAHGMERGMDLHELVLQYKYDYVALGHDHQQRRIKKNAWQCGSTARYTFAERNQDKGILEIQIKKGEEPVIRPKMIENTRSMKQIEMTLNTDITTVDFESKIKEEISEFKKPFNGETAARLKFKFKGAILLSNWWNMEDILAELQKETFDKDYNLLEFRWDSIEVAKRAPLSLEKGAKLYDYLIEDPVKDFERYIRSLSLENEKQAKKFIELGASIIEEVFTQTVEEASMKEEVEE